MDIDAEVADATKPRRLAKFCGCAAVFALLAAGAWFGVTAAVRHALVQQFVVTSPDSEGYAQWEYSNTMTSPQYYEYYMWNLTNALDVQDNGATPKYEEAGPYTFRTYTHLDNAKFSDSGNQASFNTRQWFEFVPQRSAGDAYADMVWNMNPAYIGAVATAGGEAKIQAGLSTSAIRVHLDFFRTTMVAGLASEAAVPLLVSRYTDMTKAVGKATFLSTWADAKTAPATDPQLWRDMLVAQANGGKPSNIAATAAGNLWDATKAGSLLDASWTASHAWWAAAEVASGATAIPEAPLVGTLAANFSITSAQVLEVARWRRAFIEARGLPAAVLTANGVSTLEELSYKQWTTVEPTANRSCAALWPQRFPVGTVFTPVWPEYGYFIDNYVVEPMPAGYLSPSLADNLLNGSLGILSVVNSQVFFDDILAQRFGDIKAKWGLNTAQTNAVNTFLLRVMTASYARPMLESLDHTSGGLMVNRSVAGWLFTAEDPLVKVLDPTRAHFGHFFDNNTATLQNTMYTGYDDTSKVGWFTQWNNMTQVDYWDPPLPVQGTAGGGFGFFVTPGSQLTTWEDALERTVVLDNTDKATQELRGVELLRFKVGDWNLDPDARYFQNISGFWNISAVKQGCPIFVSRPHFAGAGADKWRDPKYIEGVTAPDADLHYTHIDVEPTSGSTLNARKVDQVNIHISSKTGWFPSEPPPGCAVCHPNLPQDRFYPLVWSALLGEATVADTDRVKDKLYPALKARTVTTALFAVCAALTAVLGLLYTTVWWEKKKLLCITLRHRRGSDSARAYRALQDTGSDSRL